jgi:hypothetical protein
VADLEGFVREPDPVEMWVHHSASYRYERSLLDLLRPHYPRRDYLKPDGYTLIPGSHLALGGVQLIGFGDRIREIHIRTYIEQTYGYKSRHRQRPYQYWRQRSDVLMRLCRLVRVEPRYI